jgi:peroxiredoxin
MAWVCGKLWARADSVAEPLFRAVLETNPDRDAQGQACLALASMLVEAAALPRVIAEGPEMAGKVEAFYGKEHLEGLLKRDPLDLQKEGEALYERIVQRYADVRWNVDDVNDRRTLREPAEKYLLEKREMAVGKRAPEIEGLDVDGKTLRLSDHRGEVVVLVFWATWCKHCMEMIPHERELLKRHKAARFALLGVNCDSTREKMRRGMTEESITWPNWFDGSVNAGPIAARYHVASLPTIYVLDADGVIRARDVRGKALNAAVETLLARESRTPAAESPPRERPNP